MKKKQRENLAKYFYDVSKIVFSLAVLGNYLSKERFDLITFLGGVFFAGLTFACAYLLDGRED
jgi:hypothetical protein